LEDFLYDQKQIDFLLIEGAISSDRYYFNIHGNSFKKIVDIFSKRTKYIIAVGNCASYGGIPKKFTHNKTIKGLQAGTNPHFTHKYRSKSNLPIINLTGCPVHPEWIIQTMSLLKTRGTIDLDETNRPKELYNTLAHHGCTRNEYFEWKIEAKNFGEKEGCLFYDQGCRAPMTFSSCNKILWNEVSSKTRAGTPCIGCTEFDFPRSNLFETKKNIGLPEDLPVGIPKRAYYSITGIAKTFKIKRLLKKL
jgi:hydrogenase small subunit